MPYLEVTNNRLKGHVLIIPKRSPAELPEKNILLKEQFFHYDTGQRPGKETTDLASIDDKNIWLTEA